MKGKDHYDLNCIDHITKYVTAHLFVEKRTLKKCKEFLGQIKITCYDQILEIYRKEKQKPKKKRKLITFVCDGFENYKNAWSILLGRITKLVFGIPIKAKVKGLKHNNNPIERYNGKIKDRIKEKDKINVKDVTKVVRDCSEKTLQRELVSLVGKGVLVKEGERRWSTYSLRQVL